MYTFLNRNNVICNLQFYTSHALINITEKIRKALGDGNIDCGVSADSQKKASDTLAKLNHYGISGVSNNWSKSPLSNWNLYVSTNGY